MRFNEKTNVRPKRSDGKTDWTEGQSEGEIIGWEGIRVPYTVQCIDCGKYKVQSILRTKALVPIN